MLTFKLRRVGRKKQPSYRLIVTEKRRDPWGTALEIVGSYNPRTEPATVVLNEERIKYWISKGAQPTNTVHNLFVDAKLVTTPKRKTLPPGKKKESPTAVGAAPAAVATSAPAAPVEAAVPEPAPAAA